MAESVDRPAGGDETTRERVERTRRHFILSLILVFGALSFVVFAPFLSYVFMGLLFVYLVHPAYRWLRARLKHPRLTAALVLVLSFIVLLAPLVWVTFEIVETVVESSEILRETTPEELTQTVDDAIDRAYRAVGLEPPAQEGLGEQLIAGGLARFGTFLQGSAGTALELAGSVAIGLVVMLFVLYYGLVDGERFLHFVKDVSPLDRDMNDALVDEVRRTVDAVFLGHVVVSIVQGLVGGIGFLIFGLPNPIFWGFIMILFSLIPLVGAFLVWLPAGVWLLIQGNTFGGVGILLWGGIIVSTIDNVLRPKIVGAKADIHPVMVLVGVLGGLAAFGMIGLVLGPLVLAMFIAIINFWRQKYLPKYGAREDAPPRDSDAGALAENFDG